MKGLPSGAKCRVSPSDSRNQYRAPVKIVLSYRTIDQFFSDIATNISLGGIFIKTPRPLPVGTTLRISFAIPQYDSYVEANGVVIHTGTPDSAGMGIKFSEIDNRALKVIDELIKNDLCGDEALRSLPKADGEPRKAPAKKAARPKPARKRPAPKKPAKKKRPAPKKPAPKKPARKPARAKAKHRSTGKKAKKK